MCYNHITMCGIVGYIGKREAAPLIFEGLKMLEYRGYDSAGMAVGSAAPLRAVGPVEHLRPLLAMLPSDSTMGIGHTRWATHGIPAERNTHPRTGQHERVVLVHNGIIENYQDLKKDLELRGHIFIGETDSEVLAHVIEEEYEKSSDLIAAVRTSLGRVRGAYGIALYDRDNPDRIVIARQGSPLALGIGEGEYFIASDATPIVRYTQNIVYLEDGDIGVIARDGYQIMTITTPDTIERAIHHVEMDIESVGKAGFDHFMMKEIFEAPEVVRNTIRGRVVAAEGRVQLGGLIDVVDQLKNIEHLIIVGCGSAYYAGLMGAHFFETIAGMRVTVDIASEFRYRPPIFKPNTAVIAVSQSGETADTLEVLREAQRRGALTLGVVNVVGSSIARETDAGVYNHAGPEISVASTKAFLSQMTVMMLLAVYFGRQRTLSASQAQEYLEALTLLPETLEALLGSVSDIKDIAREYMNSRDFLYIGRGYGVPLALEGALKLKEISYIHAEGYGAGEMKHGPLAMIDENFPTLAIVPSNSMYEKMLSNIQEIKARKGKVIAIAHEGDSIIKQHADHVIYIPKTHDILTPMVALIPLQLFAYHIAVGKGLNVDRPRNLAKAVTVE